MRIVEAISDMNIGGAGILLLSRLEASELGAERTTVIVPKGSMLKERLDSLGVVSVEIEGCRDRSLDILAIPKMIRIIKQLSPDIVNCHGCLSARIAARLCNVPVRLYTRHCAYPHKKWQKLYPLRWLCGKLQMILSTHFIAVAEVAKYDLMATGVSESKISVIINGAKQIERYSDGERKRIREYFNVPDGACVVGIFARLEPCKGHKDLISAAELLLRKNKKYRFLIVGGGSLYDELRTLAIKKGIDKYVIFTGFAKNVTPYFNVTDINVNCSCGTETSSLALSEGMSLGIPAVVSDYGGNGYMVQNCVNGFTYEVGNYLALSKRIFLLSYGKGLYKKMSENAYARYKTELNVDNMSRETYRLYEYLYFRSRSR